MKDKVFGDSVNVTSTALVKFLNNIFSYNWFRASYMETSYAILHSVKWQKYEVISSTILLTPSDLSTFW